MEHDRTRAEHMADYRATLKSVMTETLNENNAQVRAIFKEAIKEWLNEQMQDGGAWAVRIIAACFVVIILWMVLKT